MTDCAQRFQDLTGPAEVVLDEDLAALRRMDQRSRIERYNELKANEEEFIWEFDEDCPEFLTESERARVRGKFRLARLLVVGSFYSDDGEVPTAMADDFVDAELQAVAEFDRYRQFDALSEAQIEKKIRRMDGEVYELVTEYTSTQLADLERLLEHPDVQQDLMERLLDRYERRREKIRHGFFTYVEAHGLEHMVESIEEAVEAVNSASAEREAVREQLHETAETGNTDPGSTVLTRQELESKLQSLRRELSTGEDVEQLRGEIDRLGAQLESVVEEQDSAVSEVDSRIERTADLEARLEKKIQQLQQTKHETRSAASEEAGRKASKLVENEIEQLREEREQIRTELDRLEREREEIVAAREALDRKQDELDDRVSQVQESLDTTTTGDGEAIDGSNAVTAEIARLLEMDYLGRFDISMRETESLYTGETNFAVPDGYWDERSQRRNNRGHLLDILEGGRPNQYPVNGAARYEVTMPGPLGIGSNTEMVIEARVLSNLHAQATNGFDAQPAGLDALLAVVNEAVAEAEDGGYTYLVGLASPTGWSEQVRNQVQTDEISRSRYSRHVSICLIDLQDGSLVYDESDDIVRENLELFAHPVDSERLQSCVETIRQEYVDSLGTESVLLRDVTDQHGYEEQVVKRAFNQLEDEGAGEQLYLDELGLSLNVGT